MRTAAQTHLMNGKATADTDGDGYPDYMDLCPTQPETFNGIDDKDAALMIITD